MSLSRPRLAGLRERVAVADEDCFACRRRLEVIACGRGAWRKRGAHRGRGLTRRVDHGNLWRFGYFFDEPSTGRNHGADEQEAAQPGARRTDALIVVLSVLELQNVTALRALAVIVVDLIVVISGRRFRSRRNGALLGWRRREGCSGGRRSGGFRGCVFWPPLGRL